jgi:hypothetical protein
MIRRLCVVCALIGTLVTPAPSFAACHKTWKRAERSAAQAERQFERAVQKAEKAAIRAEKRAEKAAVKAERKAVQAFRDMSR